MVSEHDSSIICSSQTHQTIQYFVGWSNQHNLIVGRDGNEQRRLELELFDSVNKNTGATGSKNIGMIFV